MRARLIRHSLSAAILALLPAISAAASLAVRVEDGILVDGDGNALQLRGVNYSGFEFASIQGWAGWDPSGGQAGQRGGPRWSALQEWKVNTLRLPLNEASWLGHWCIDTNDIVRNPDPTHNYRNAVIDQVRQANAAGLYVILDLHWSAPGIQCPMLQTQMANADHSVAFWLSVAATFRDNPAVMFELFNEPFFNFEFSGDAWQFMMHGAGGTLTGYPATGAYGTWKRIQQPWAAARYQTLIDAVRSAGATNVVLVGGMHYSQDLSGWLAHRPYDSLGQLAAAWHPYPSDGAAWGTPEYAQPNFAPGVFADIERLLEAGIPVIATETGERNPARTVGAPLLKTVTDFADRRGIGVIGFTWNVWTSPKFVLTKDAAGTPTEGYGVAFRDWLRAH
jgi:hypothetical protein